MIIPLALGSPISPVSCSLLALMPSWAKLTLGTWLEPSVASSSYAPSPCSRLVSTGNFLCLRIGFPARWDGTLTASSSALSDPVPTELRLGASDNVLGASELLSLLLPDRSNRESYTSTMVAIYLLDKRTPLTQGNCSSCHPPTTTLCSNDAHWATIR